jgi:hypothetical protein
MYLRTVDGTVSAEQCFPFGLADASLFPPSRSPYKKYNRYFTVLQQKCDKFEENFLIFTKKVHVCALLLVLDARAFVVVK